MTTPADIRAVWAANIWTAPAILAYTDKIFDYNIIDEAKTDTTRLRFNQKINFFTYLTIRDNEEFESGGKEIVQHSFNVLVSLYIEADHDGAAYNQVIDRLVEVESLVISALGEKWAGNVDLYRLTARGRPELIELDGRATWLGQDEYTAFKRVQYT